MSLAVFILRLLYALVYLKQQVVHKVISIKTVKIKTEVSASSSNSAEGNGVGMILKQPCRYGKGTRFMRTGTVSVLYFV